MVAIRIIVPADVSSDLVPPLIRPVPHTVGNYGPPLAFLIAVTGYRYNTIVIPLTSQAECSARFPDMQIKAGYAAHIT